MVKKITLGLIALVILTTLILRSPLIRFFEFLADYDTEYTKDFTYEKFNQVKVGMSMNEVLNLIGEPFDKDEFPYPNIASGTKTKCYWYSQPEPASQTIQQFEDINWHRVGICFFEDRVISVDKTTFFD